ncbi:hypothetical protein H2200_012348 [Cladophialophora chaetospira]|uniref:Clr5 domain-containing protein n=1 Tax=Cladophialophora chaetospira TaxID=386627 RepID=A0AA38WXP8_9EURO|nr:hypothetical protein H2200_012348 [Cladophialophora chaetospira]
MAPQLQGPELDAVMEDRKEDIIAMRHVGTKVEDILNILNDEEHVKIGRAKSYQYLKAWNAQTQNQPLTDEQILQGVIPLARSTLQSDAEIASNLTAQFGVGISHRQVKRARCKYRVLRITRDPTEREKRRKTKAHVEVQASALTDRVGAPPTSLQPPSQSGIESTLPQPEMQQTPDPFRIPYTLTDRILPMTAQEIGALEDSLSFQEENPLQASNWLEKSGVTDRHFIIHLAFFLSEFKIQMLALASFWEALSRLLELWFKHSSKEASTGELVNRVLTLAGIQFDCKAHDYQTLNNALKHQRNKYCHHPATRTLDTSSIELPAWYWD